MTLIKLCLKEVSPDTASRDSGKLLRDQILTHLKDKAMLEIDFTDVHLTPSFADEAFGLLCHDLTHKAFLEKIKFVHLTFSHKALLARVIANRFRPSP